MTDDAKKSKWGWGIAAFYLGFMFFILILVLYASIQDFQMVEDNYYAKDLVYQEQIDRIERAGKLDSQVSAEYNNTSKVIEVRFPVYEEQEISGVIKLFRPSNARLDFEIPIAVDSAGFQNIDAVKMIPGYWQIKIAWQVDSVEYYDQSPLMIN